MNEFRQWILKVLDCKTLEEFQHVLTGFNEGAWSLEEKSIMSGVYTPRVMTMLSGGEEQAWWLEELASLCWNAGKVA